VLQLTREAPGLAHALAQGAWVYTCAGYEPGQ